MANKTNKEKILIVDDVSANIKVLGEALQEHYDIVFEMSGQKALDMVRSSPPDLILLDIMMPEINGYEVCQKLKADNRTKNIPVIFITSMKEEEEETKGFKAGAVDYITKPFKPLTVKARVGTHLALKNHRDHLEEMVKARTAELEKAKDAAEAANITKSELLTNTSHEFRTPLNAVIGFTDMILETELNNNQKEYARIVKQNGEMVLCLLNDILDFSKIESGDLELEETDFDPASLSHEVCESIQKKMGKQTISVRCNIGGTVPSHARGDALRYRQVLSNLMSNAFKFTEMGEILFSFDVENEKEGRIKFHVTVQDTGIGIPEDKKIGIFTPFQQADGSSTRKYGGTGLGLSICKKLAELMDGDLWVESNMEQGSTFHFTGWFGKSEKTVQKEESQVSLSDKKVLIVEDNLINQKLAKIMVSKVGCQVDVANDGKEAVEKISEQPDGFDLILMDIQMPNMNGIQATKAIREKGYTKIPIVAVTAHAMKHDKKECLDAGMNDYATKPIKKPLISEIIHKWIVNNPDG